jgi:signal transduction histidine kinase
VVGSQGEEEVTQRVLIDHRLRAADPVQRDRARLAVLAEVSLLLASSSDYFRILQKLTEMAVPALADWCAVHVVVAGGELQRVAIRHSDPEMAMQAGADDFAAATARRVIATGESAWMPDISYLCVPLPVRARVIGVLTLVRTSEGLDYGADDVAFVEELARRVAMYVDNALLLREVQARESALRDEANRLETLNRIGQELAEIHDLDHVVKKVCEAATTLTRAELGVFYTLDGDRPTIATCGARTTEAAALAARAEDLSRSAPELSLAGPRRLDDVRISHANLGVLAGLDRVTSYLAVPVRGRRGDVIGAIALGHSRAGAFDDRDEQLLVGLASLTATATDSARLFHAYRGLISELEKSNHDLDQFAYVTSHDLRAPLRGIANLATWLEEDVGDGLSEGAREHLRLLRTRVQRLEDIIEGVLDYSRAGRVDDEPVDVDTGALAREVVELLAPPSHVTMRIDRFMPTVRTTRVQLQQVLMNLVANALQHNDGTEPRVEIGAEPIADGWEFYVRDNGPGIAARHHAQIWRLFQTLQPRDRTASTGIGLAIVKKIVEAHGGRVWIDSEEGRGATFRFTWPKTPTQRSWSRHITAK